MSYTNGRKGAEAERKAARLLTASGFVCVRAAGSRGLIDLIAFSSTNIRLLQIKCGAATCSPAEKEQLRLLPRPSCATVEVCRFKPRARSPLIEVL
jgi:Holliday junction resolvase